MDYRASGGQFVSFRLDPSNCHVKKKRKANSVFAVCDLNKNGQIERDELQFLCEAMHQRTRPGRGTQKLTGQNASEHRPFNYIPKGSQIIFQLLIFRGELLLIFRGELLVLGNVFFSIYERGCFIPENEK